MNKHTRRIAVSGMMAALATAILLMGGVIPAATFAGPALAGLLVVPVYVEGGQRLALGAWIAVSALSLMLCGHNEAALLLAFRGWDRAVKWPLDAWLRGWRAALLKLLMWNASAAAMAALIFYVVRMDQVLAEYREMSLAMLVAFAVLANVTMLLYDRLLGVMSIIYQRKIRQKWYK